MDQHHPFRNRAQTEYLQVVEKTLIEAEIAWTIPAEDIWKIEPDMTVIGGEVVYTRPVPPEK
jgi:hypothetical protein